MSKEDLKTFNTWTRHYRNRSTILVVNWLLWIRLVSPKSLEQVKEYLFWERSNYKFTSVISFFFIFVNFWWDLCKNFLERRNHFE